jgi:hypothetical protein
MTRDQPALPASRSRPLSRAPRIRNRPEYDLLQT